MEPENASLEKENLQVLFENLPGCKEHVLILACIFPCKNLGRSGHGVRMSMVNWVLV